MKTKSQFLGLSIAVDLITRPRQIQTRVPPKRHDMIQEDIENPNRTKNQKEIQKKKRGGRSGICFPRAFVPVTFRV
jgi:hypothetical protein